MDALWPDLDAKSVSNNLHRTLHFAREVLEPTLANAAPRYLPLRGDLLELCPDSPLSVDVEAFESAAASARRGREPAAYRAAVDLYTGDLLPGDLYEAWAEERREGLRLTHLSLLLEMAGLHEERGEYGPGIEALRRVLAEEPSHEEAHAGLMRLLALRGGWGEAILQYERLRKVLSREFGVEPSPATQHLYEEVRAERLPAVPALSGRPEEPVSSSSNNLPASMTSFVGREHETLEVKRLLATTRLLTLTGAGGCGKTRLALEIARDLVGTYPDGVWLVELAALSRPELAPRAVEEAMRYFGAIRGTGRFASEDIVYKDVLFPQGTFIAPSMATANRDPAVFADPGTFDITREPAGQPQLTFGSGIHYCLGAALARAELQEALPLLARRMPDLRIDGEVVWKPNTVGIFGAERLPVAFTPGH